MKAHIIENNTIVNTIEVESLDFLPNLIDASIGGTIGWGYLNGVLTAPIIPITVPQTLSPRQIRMVLTANNLRTIVENTVATSTDYALKDWWEYSLEYLRDNPLLVSTATALGLTDAHLDQMFIDGAKL